MAERNLDHAQSMMETALQGDIADTRQGRWFGFAALSLLIIAAAVVGLMGQPVLAGLFLGAGVLGVISQLIRGKNGSTK